MKLVYILPVYDAKTTTHHRHLYAMIEELARSIDVFVIVERGTTPDIPGIAGSLVLGGSSLVRPFLLLRAFLNLRRRGYRAAYVHYSYWGVLLARLAGFRTWYWNCGQMWLFSGFRNSIVLPFVVRVTSYLITGTQFMAQGYAKHYGKSLDRIRVVPNWIDVARWCDLGKREVEDVRARLGLPSEARAVLFVHRLAPRKGSRYLPPIWTLCAADPTVHVVVVGGGPDREWLTAERDRSPHKERIHLVGGVANSEVPAYMRLANVFIMPSEEEGFPRVVLEAMAAGTPIAAFETGGLGEILPPELMRFVVPVGDVSGLAAAVHALLKPDAQRSQLLQRHVEQFDTARVAERFLALFHASSR